MLVALTAFDRHTWSPVILVRASKVRANYFRSDDDGEYVFSSATARPSNELRCGYPIKDMKIAYANRQGRGSKRALPVRTQNAGSSSRPRQAQACQQRDHSSCNECQNGENISRCAPAKQSSDAGTKRRESYRALRMRAQNAGDISRPRRGGKRRVQSSSTKPQKHQRINQDAPMQQSSDAVTDGGGRYRALRMRAQNAGDVGPKQAKKR